MIQRCKSIIFSLRLYFKSLNGLDYFYLFILLFILIAGIVVRFIGLGTHFSHIDDLAPIMIMQKLNSAISLPSMEGNGFFAKMASDIIYPLLNGDGFGAKIVSHITYPIAVSYISTYAPAQFFITSFLINPDQSYQELLFWGRFPSFIFGVLTLFLLVVFYIKLYGNKFLLYTLLPLALVAFSWEDIIYSNQSESYAIGVFSSLIALILLIHTVKTPGTSAKKLFFCSIILAFLSYTQYQIMFFVPAFFFALFIYYIRQGIEIKKIFGIFTIGSGIYGLLISPILILFKVSNRFRSGVNWNAGPNGEFLLDYSGCSSLFSYISKTVSFFLKNTFIVMQSNFSFINDDNQLFFFVFVLLFLFLSLGIFSYLLSNSTAENILGVFFAGVTVTWVVLIFMKALTLSPTRHSLILLAFMAIVCSEGLRFILKGKIKPISIGSILLVFVISASFFLNFQDEFEKRQDPFNEQQLTQIASSYAVDCMITYDLTSNIDLMQFSSDYTRSHFIDESKPHFVYTKNGVSNYHRILLLSHHNSLDINKFDEIKNQIINLTGDLIDWDNCNIIYKDERYSDVEVCFSERTKNGSNNYFLYVIQL